MGVSNLGDPSVSKCKADVCEVLENTLTEKIKRTLVEFEANLPQVETQLVYNALGKVDTSIPIESIQAKWETSWKTFHTNTAHVVSGLSQLPSAEKKNLSSKVKETFEALSAPVAGAIGASIQQLRLFLEKDRDFQPVVPLKTFMDALKDGKVKSLSNLEEILKKIDRIQLEVDGLSDERRVGPSVIVKLDKFKEDIFKAVMEIKETIATTIRDNLNSDLQAVDTFIIGTQGFLKRKAANIQELDELKKEYTDVLGKFKAFDEDVRGFDLKLKIIAEFGFKGNSAANVANIRRKWDTFATKFGGFSYVITGYEAGVRKRVKSELERMSGEIDRFYARIQSIDLNKTQNMSKEQEAQFSNQLKEIRRQWEDIQKVIGESLNNADAYGVDLSDLKSLKGVREYFKGPFAEWMVYFEFLSGIEKMEKEDWISFKYQIYDFQKYILEWVEKLKGKKDASSKFILDQCELFKDIWPALKSMIGEGFQRNHWTELFSIIGLPKNRPFNEVTFGEILNKRDVIYKKIDEIKFLAARAQGEIALREALTDLGSWCESTVFTFTEFVDQEKNTLGLIKEWTDILTEVGDNQVVLQNIKDSKFSANFTDQIESFEKKLGGLDELILKLNQIQRKWMYLEPVFGRGALPSEQGRFRRVDDEYRNIMQALQKEPQVVTLSQIPNVSDTLDMLLDQLDRCQKALNSYLEEKRNIFPRFYFLGDDDLLELLGQSTNLEVVHSHLRKLYSGVSKLKTNSSNPDKICVEELLSSKSESVSLKGVEKIYLTKEVESWLGNLTEAMNKTLEASLKTCIKAGDQPKVEDYPGQVLEIADSVHFCEKVVKAIPKSGLSAVKQDYTSKLAELTSNKNKMNALGQMKVKNIILDIIHDIAVLDELIDAQVTTLEDWVWFKQLKYRLDKSSNVMVGMGKAEFCYTYEYQGNVSKLVHTPLTDKCYLTLTQGMMMGYGGNPYGPAGTGKTESVKALGYAFGRQVLVFNCDEGIDYQSMGRIFIGLVKCGAWGCFDEFNRLLEDQLSAISQQIQIIQYAIKEGVPKITMLGQETTVSTDAGIFVTMNPAGKAYGGRSKLPDNLKALFRPVAMAKPDNEMISEFLLFAEGYSNAKTLAKKIVTVFTLSRQLLSPQQHYDWGLRALKTILVVAGQLVQKSFEAGEKVDQKKESELLIKAIRVNTMSKLTFADTLKFEALMSNIFMGVAIEDVKYEDLTTAITEVLTELNLSFVERQVAKIRQFYEAVRQRMGVVLVGPSGCSKTTIWKVLKAALKKLGQEIKVHILNPKSVSRTELLGNMNNETREFVDGILTSLARKVVKEGADTMSWIICDGDIDPEWIESLNSVLDDNHLLTLPNGERIALGSNINFIFETHDLKFASPATVSRMGMMYLNNEDINTDSIIKTWITGLPTLAANYLTPKLQSDMGAIMDILISHEAFSVVESTRVGLLNNLLSHLSSVTNDKDYAIGLYRGLSASVRPDKRESVSAEVQKLTGEEIKDEQLLVTFEGVDNRTDPLEKYLPTQESRIVLGYLRPWIKHTQPFIVAGPEGCGKETIIRAAFSELGEKVRFVTVYSNSQLNSRQVLSKIYEHTIKSTVASGKILKPKDCNRLVIYIKDINLPRPDKYQTTEVVSLLQQMLTHHGFYDENLEFVSLDARIQIVATLNPVISFGRYKLSTRFTANVRILSIDIPSLKELGKIYFAMLKNYSTEAKQGLSPECLKKSAIFLTNVYDLVSRGFLPQKHSHYIFTPKDMTRVIGGIQHFSIDGEREFMDVLQVLVMEVFGNKMANIDDHYNFACAVVEKVNSDLGCEMIDPSVEYTRLMSSDGVIKKTTKEELEKHLRQELLSYEKSHEELKLNFNTEVLEWIVRLEHVLGAGKHVLAVGTSGSGRRILTKYVSHLLGFEYKTFFPTRVYKLREFKKDMRRVVEFAGVTNKKTVLMLEDHHFEDEQNLVFVNTFLSSGDVQGIIKCEEVEQLLGKDGVDELMKKYIGNTVLDSFIMRLKDNLKLVVSLDHSSKKFAKQISFNPALLKVCSIIWAREWRLESKTRFFQEELMKMKDTKDLLVDQFFEKFWKVFMKIHLNSTKPNLYLFDYIKTFEKILEAKRGSIGDTHKRLTDGLSKITEANAEVDVITQKAEEMRLELGQKQKEADLALDTITKAVETATVSKSEAESLRKFLIEEEGKTKDTKVIVEEQLTKVEPVIAEAKKGIKGISKGDLNELKSYTMCPEEIITVFNALFILIGEGDISWTKAKTYLKQSTFLDEIVVFDARKITEKNRTQVEKLIEKHKSSFEKDKIYRISNAAGPISMFVVALTRLSKVYHEIGPLEKQLAEVDEKLSSSRVKLRKCETDVAELDSKVKMYQQEFSNKTKEAAQLKDKLSKVEDTLARAKSLLEKLTDEKERWSQQAADISSEVTKMPYNCVLSAGYCIYLSEAEESKRATDLAFWKKISKNDTFEFCNFNFSESQFLKWKAVGHPSDQLSLENTTIYYNVTKPPLIIDPSGRIEQWILSNEANNKNFERVLASDDKILTQLDLAVRFGKTLIVTEMSTVDSFYLSLLRKDLQRQAGRMVVMIGEKAIDYNPSFRLVFSTRDTTIDLHPKIKATLAVINYSVTRSGLEMQLLSIVINHEKPELEAKKIKILEQEDAFKVQLAEVENQLLNELATSTGNLLDNRNLIISLEEAKSKSQTITENLTNSKRITEAIDKERETYKQLSVVGAQIFLLLKELPKISNMYRYSLSFFIQIFVRTLSEKSSETLNIQQVCEQILVNALRGVAMGTKNRDRLTLALHLLHGVKSDQFGEGEWQYFTEEAVATNRGEILPSWLPPQSSVGYEKFSALFPQLTKSFGLDTDLKWKKWYGTQDCEKNFPVQNMTEFQKVLLVKALREDRLENALVRFVESLLGSIQVIAPKLDLEDVYLQESMPGTPILFIIAPGSDPSSQLEEFAIKKVSKERFVQMSLGGNQNELAMKTLKSGAESGQWVLLKNLHLVPAFLTLLEKEFAGLTKHKDFRLWLTTEPTEKFPALLLETCYKVAYESPPGVKKNIERAYSLVDESFLSKSALNKQLVFVLSYFHSVVQERREFVPQGWSKAYEFSYSDFVAAIRLFDSLGVTKPTKSILTTYAGLLENAVYGGRIDNEMDVRLLRAYLQRLFSVEVFEGKVPVFMNFNSTQAVGSAEAALKVFESLPDKDTPESFGLSTTADVSVQKAKVAEIVANIKTMSSGSVAEIKYDTETWTTGLANIFKVWKVVYKQMVDAGVPQVKDEQLATTNPIASLIYSEVKTGVAMVKKMAEKFKKLVGVLKGEVPLEKEIEEFGAILLANKVPDDWDNVLPDILSPSEWLNTYFKKVTSLKSWLEGIESGALLKEDLSLADLLNPDILLNAYKLYSAQKLSVPVDDLILETSFEKETQNPKLAPLKVRGLLLQGCSYNNKRLEEQESKSEYEMLPACYFSFKPRSAAADTKELLQVPLFSNLSREKQILDIWLPFNGNRTNLVIRSTALAINP